MEECHVARLEVSKEQREAPVRRAGEGHRAELEKLSAQAGLPKMPLCLAASAPTRRRKSGSPLDTQPNLIQLLCWQKHL